MERKLLLRTHAMGFERLIIIGVGLLGGSVGLAAKKHGVVKTVIGVDRSSETLQIAADRQIVDASFSEIEQIPHSNVSTLVVVCTPVAEIPCQVYRLLKHFDEAGTKLANGTILITDVGSTKEKLCRAIDDPRFLGSHPIAGSEKSGPQHADADLFENRQTILTPTEKTPQTVLHRLTGFWNSLGSSVECMTPERHDKIFAATSHLPHAISVILASFLSDEERSFTGTGYAGMTRLAKSSPEVWIDIFWENDENILKALERFGEKIEQLIDTLKTKNTDSLRHFFRKEIDSF